MRAKKTPRIAEEPLVNTIRFENSDQCMYFEEWSSLSMSFLSGGLAHTRLWTATMPQLTLEEPTLRYGAMAVGALRLAYMQEGHHIGSALTTANRHYLSAITYYCEALRLQSKAKPTREGLRTAMLSSLLFICFETQRANMPAALKHITHGFSMLNELAACTEKAPDLVSIAPAPPTLVEEILDCYRPLELQSRSFIGSYSKFFFPGNRKPGTSPQGPVQEATGQQAAGDGGGPLEQVSTPSPDAVATHSPPPASRVPGQTETQWQAQASSPAPTPGQDSQTGLPSPQSQGSPQRHGDKSTPPKPQKPPGIMPFDRQSPYFRPKQSTITSLEELPRVFSSLDEAQGYWALLQKQMVQYMPVLALTTKQLNLTRLRDEAELEGKLASVKLNPRISKFVAESRYWLQRWIEAYDALYQPLLEKKESNLQSYLHAASLRVEYLVLDIYTALPRYSDLETAKALTPRYREINVLAETLLNARPNCGFAMDSGWTWPLFVSAFGCREEAVRVDAIRILGQYPIRNALRDSRVFRAIALRNQLAEAETAAWDKDEKAQWLRLRRREVVFEDYGMNIIFRSAQRDAATGKWELVEEAAGFMVQPDGTLNWQRQPISDSTSLLSGVC